MTIHEKIEQVDTLKNELGNLLPMVSSQEDKLWKKFRLDWNFNSNHMEGNTLTYPETELLLFFDKVDGNHELHELEEMKAHDVAIHMVREWAKDKSRDITENDIRELNKIILVKPFWKEAITPNGDQTRRLIKIGEYKEYPNSVRLANGEIFEYSSPLETPSLMQELFEFYKKYPPISGHHPVWLAAMMHYKLVRIHPFDDGNGRVARLLMNYILMKNDYPPVLIKSTAKNEYRFALNQADVGNSEFFYYYIADQLVKSLEVSIKAAKNEDISEDDDFEKEIKQIELSLKSQKKEVLKKNKDLVRQIWENSIWPLHNALYDKISKSAPLFTEFEIRSSKDHRINSGDKAAQDKFLNDYFRDEHLRQVRIGCHLRGFKGGDAKNLFDVSCYIDMQFNDFDYNVDAKLNSIDDYYPIKKLYSEQLTDDDINSIVNVKAKSVLKQIKESYKRLTGKEL